MGGEVMEQSLLLLDGHSIVRRVYEARKANNPKGQDEQTIVESSMYSALMSIQRALDEHPTTHGLAVFDYGGENWRHRIYPEYKANREPTTPEFKAGVHTLRTRINRTLGLCETAIEDAEADDVITTVTRRWDYRGPVTLLTTDKDLTWLVAHGVRIWNHFEGHWRDAEWCMRKMGVEPYQVLDYLALVGDKTDNVPGLHGCGPKTAAAWLEQYGTLENIIANADVIPGALGTKLKLGMDRLLMSRKLVSLASNINCGGLTLSAMLR
jgi:DNA polymerase-1